MINKFGYVQIAEKLFSSVPLHVPFILDCYSETNRLHSHTGKVYPNEFLMEKIADRILKVIPCDRRYDQVFILTIEAGTEFSGRQEMMEHLVNLQLTLGSATRVQIGEGTSAVEDSGTVYHSAVSGRGRMGNIVDHIMSFYEAKSAA